jgi:outer membrane protein assembly factor BamA
VDGGESSQFNILPFSTVSATTRQIFPLSQEGRRLLTLALQHSAATSTTHLPRHEAKALGILSKIRGYEPSGNDRVSSYVVGSTELRIPVTLPTDKLRQDASIVIFGDWSLAQKDLQSSFVTKTSIGIGLRKGIQGIPLKYDLSYTGDGKFRAFFGLGRDFDV